jgi:DNA-binding NarL/FixJ family response regulator
MFLTIVLANEYELVRQGILSVVHKEPELQVIGECSSPRELLCLVSSKSPDLAILDLPMTDLDIFEVMEEIKNLSPKTRVLVLSGYPEAPYLRRLLNAGVAGYVLRTGSTSDLIDAIHSASLSTPYVTPSLKPLLASDNNAVDFHTSRTDVLSPRQGEVLRMIANGLSSKEIATRLGIAESTVKTHRKTIMERLEIHDKVGLTRYAIRVGLIRPHEKNPRADRTE